MYRIAIPFVYYIFLLQLILTAEDSKLDSSSVFRADSVFSDSVAGKNDIVKGKKSKKDTLSDIGDSEVDSGLISDGTASLSLSEEATETTSIKDSLPVKKSKADTVSYTDITFDTPKKDKADSETISIPYTREKKEILKLGKYLQILKQYVVHFFVLAVSFCIILFTLIFYRKKMENKCFLTSTRLSLMDREVRIACKYMEKHFNDPDLTAEKLCNVLITGQAFLETLFENELGMSISDFLVQVRINRAKIFLMEDKNIPLEDLSCRVGFFDKKQLINNFKNSTGITIEEYLASLSVNGRDQNG